MARTTKADAAAIEEAVNSSDSKVNKDVLRAIQTAKLALKKKFGDDVFAEKTPEKMPSISTGSTKLDAEIGNEGIVLGRIHEVFGNSGDGKSTTCVLLCVNSLKTYEDKSVLYLDFEQAMDTRYAQQLGLDVDSDRFIFVQPKTAEEGFEIMDMMMSTGGFSLCVIDSVAAMITQYELEKGYDEMTIGVKAKFLSTNIPKLLDKAKETNTAIVFVNQVREKVGVYGGGTTTPGGKALPFYCTTRLELRRLQVLTKGDVPYGQTVRFTVRKNKVGRPFGVVETDLIFGKGFNPVLETVDLAIDMGILKKSGAWIKVTHQEEQLTFQGRANAIEYYENNKKHYEDLFDRVIGRKEEIPPVEEQEEQKEDNENDY